MAAQESPRTTKLYYRKKERFTQDEVEWINVNIPPSAKRVSKTRPPRGQFISLGLVRDKNGYVRRQENRFDWRCRKGIPATRLIHERPARLNPPGFRPDAAPHPVGGAIASRARPRVSEPIGVTATAATVSITAIVPNTTGTPPGGLDEEEAGDDDRGVDPATRMGQSRTPKRARLSGTPQRRKSASSSRPIGLPVLPSPVAPSGFRIGLASF